jgi:hypothetical protein
MAEAFFPHIQEPDHRTLRTALVSPGDLWPVPDGAMVTLIESSGTTQILRERSGTTLILRVWWVE